MMAGQQDLKSIAEARLQAAGMLIQAKDWDGAAYLLGCALECALKATVCKTLHLEVYPEGKGRDDEFFCTHRFDRLQRVSGLEDLFGAKGDGFEVWSKFTQEYDGSWTDMRYKINQFDEQKVKMLYNCLASEVKGSEGIFKLLLIKCRL